jgi:serine/threonine-protein kinase
MGVVYEAFDTVLERKVALKILSADLDAPDQLVREARLAAALEHEHIVPVYEVGEHEGIAYFTMKYVGGGPLVSPAPSALEAARTTLTIANAVAFAHRHGILHRDLKPTNVLVEGGRPFVTDFGLSARETLPIAADLERSGTPAYMPPEVWRAEPGAASTMADVWGLGVILYEQLTGKPPFEAATLGDLGRQVMTEAPPPPRGAPPDLAAICLRCLEKSAARRYSDAGALAKDLAHFIAGDPVEARPLPVTARLYRRARKHPAIAALGALLAVAAIYAGLTTLSLSRTRSAALHAADATARSIARLTALEFDRYSASVVAAARKPCVAAALSAPDPTAAFASCAEDFGEVDVDAWFLLEPNATMIGRAPLSGAHPTVGRSYEFRDYFRGAKELANARREGAYVSHAYRSEGDDIHEIAISSPVYDKGVWVGVLVTALPTGSVLGSIKFEGAVTEDFTASLLAPRDGSRGDAIREPEPIFILHRGLDRGAILPARATPSSEADTGSDAFVSVVPVRNTPFSVLVHVAVGS